MHNYTVPLPSPSPSLSFSPVLQPESSGDGEGSGTIQPSPSAESGSTPDEEVITCNIAPNAAVEIFTVADSFIQCSTTSQSQQPLLFTFINTTSAGNFITSRDFTERELASTFIGDLIGFDLRTYRVNISVCVQAENGTCDVYGPIPVLDLGMILVTVTPSTNRLFPYGILTDDSSFRGVLDGAVAVYSLRGIPFFSNYYNRLYVS